MAVTFPEPTTFRYEEAGAIATITLNRPDRLNALTFDVYAELSDLFQALTSRQGIKCVVITGEGRGFCSGGDVEAIIGQLLNRNMMELIAFTRMTGALIRRIRECTKPVVAAINGVAAGAGAVIALACDFRIASENASLAFLFTKVGLAGADMGAAYLLPRVVGLARATEILFLGDRIAAVDAERLGLVTRVVPAAQLMTEARALAERLAQGPSFALGMTKQLLNTELDLDFAAAIEAEAHGQAICMQTRNFREFHAAFAAKRPPEFD
ncbi:MAG TPA: enoyl-CoA hydratase family protein [Vicinamibacterales bacterium]|nr:enoyl-CoA hydratase family protein [Vicinamibacterales bacterium]